MALEIQARGPGSSIRPRPLRMALAPRLRPVGSFPRRSASSPSNSSLPATGRRLQRDEFAWVSICFWIESASAGAGIRETASYMRRALPAHVEATAIALLALQDEKRTPAIQASLDWLRTEVRHHRVGGESRLVHPQPVRVPRAGWHLKPAWRRSSEMGATFGTTLLSLLPSWRSKCGEMIHPFEVLR